MTDARIERIQTHEWVFIKSRWTDAKNGAKISRCMHCQCERLKLYNSTSFYTMPDKTKTTACPPCPHQQPKLLTG